MAPGVGRIGDRETFQALRRSSLRVRRGPVTITWAQSRSHPAPRVAYAVGRRVGGAVARNRVRRRLRAICAESVPTLSPGAYLIAVAQGGGALSYRELRAYVHQALEALSEEGRR